MSESIRKDFPDWENLYESQRVEAMPWYNENFDFDLEKESDERKIINNNDDGKKLQTQELACLMPSQTHTSWFLCFLLSVHTGVIYGQIISLVNRSKIRQRLESTVCFLHRHLIEL
jgi:hypothetical protein